MAAADAGEPTRFLGDASPDATMAAAPAPRVGGTMPDWDMAALTPGQRFHDDFVIEEKLGEGGMGEVYKAVNMLNDHRVAIKLIRADVSHDETYVRQFREEDDALRRLSHPAVVRYLGMRRDPASDRLYLMMDHVPGPSLRSHLETASPLSATETRRLCVRLSSGLADAHGNGVFHRDLSPDNILLEDGNLDRAKIIDFGIAKVAQDGNQTVVRTDFRGKMSYASPEHFSRNAPIDARSDLYSLGLVLSAAAMGRPLDMGRDAMTAAQARLTVPDLTGMPDDLRPLLSWLLQPDPRHRPQSARELIDHIHRRRPVISRRTIVVGGTGLLLAVAIIGGVLYWPPTPEAGKVADTGPATTSSVAGQPVRQAEATPPAGPAAIVPPSLDEVRQWARTVGGCAHLSVAATADGGFRLAGLVGDAAGRDRVVGMIRQRQGRVEDLSALSPTACGVIDALQGAGTLVRPGMDDALSADAGRDPALFRVGESATLRLSATLSGPRHVYIVALSGDGAATIIATPRAIPRFQTQDMPMRATEPDWTLLLGMTSATPLSRVAALGRRTTGDQFLAALSADMGAGTAGMRATWTLTQVR